MLHFAKSEIFFRFEYKIFCEKKIHQYQFWFIRSAVTWFNAIFCLLFVQMFTFESYFRRLFSNNNNNSHFEICIHIGRWSGHRQCLNYEVLWHMKKKTANTFYRVSRVHCRCHNKCDSREIAMAKVLYINALYYRIHINSSFNWATHTCASNSCSRSLYHNFIGYFVHLFSCWNVSIWPNTAHSRLCVCLPFFNALNCANCFIIRLKFFFSLENSIDSIESWMRYFHAIFLFLTMKQTQNRFYWFEITAGFVFNKTRYWCETDNTTTMPRFSKDAELIECKLFRGWLCATSQKTR